MKKSRKEEDMGKHDDEKGRDDLVRMSSKETENN
jgi:hypothetical protein